MAATLLFNEQSCVAFVKYAFRGTRCRTVWRRLPYRNSNTDADFEFCTAIDEKERNPAKQKIAYMRVTVTSPSWCTKET